MKKSSETIEKCKALFENVTPLKKKDCGVLCDCACCKGDDETGMLLFPGEESTLRVTECEAGRLAVCDGRCNRSERPLACRIFPFLPVINEKGKIEVIVDPRGMGICPLARNAGMVKFSRKFLRNVKKCGEILASDEKTRAFLEEVRRNFMIEN